MEFSNHVKQRKNKIIIFKEVNCDTKTEEMTGFFFFNQQFLLTEPEKGGEWLLPSHEVLQHWTSGTGKTMLSHYTYLRSNIIIFSNCILLDVLNMLIS